MSTGSSFSGVKRPGRELTTHLQLVPRSRKCGSIYPLPRTPSWRSAQLVKHRDNFTFTFTFIKPYEHRRDVVITVIFMCLISMYVPTYRVHATLYQRTTKYALALKYFDLKTNAMWRFRKVNCCLRMAK
jgi:hypothetical protein